MSVRRIDAAGEFVQGQRHHRLNVLWMAMLVVAGVPLLSLSGAPRVPAPVLSVEVDAISGVRDQPAAGGDLLSEPEWMRAPGWAVDSLDAFPPLAPAGDIPVSLALYSLVTPPSAEPEVDPANTDFIGGIDYTDHVGSGGVPLEPVAGRRDERLSRGFRVGDFASKDGAAYARISDRLVKVLERLRVEAGSLAIISGYRHRAYNDQVERSAKSSQHIAGQAADVWSAKRNPLELADLAIEVIGCNIGLGLGPNTLHIDLRGRLASWTYPGAQLEEAEFDAWIQRACGIVPDDGEVEVQELPAAPDSASFGVTDSTHHAEVPDDSSGARELSVPALEPVRPALPSLEPEVTGRSLREAA